MFIWPKKLVFVYRKIIFFNRCLEINSNIFNTNPYRVISFFEVIDKKVRIAQKLEVLFKVVASFKLTS